MTDYNKNLPDGSKAANLLDDDTAANFTALEERLTKEHYFPVNSDVERYGRHKFGVGSASDRDSAILSPAEGNLWLNEDLPAVQIHDGSGWLTARGYGYGDEAARNAIVAADRPIGFLWLRSDTNSIEWWNGSSWEIVERPFYNRMRSTLDETLPTPGTHDWTDITSLTESFTNLDSAAMLDLSISLLFQNQGGGSRHVWARILFTTGTPWVLGTAIPIGCVRVHQNEFHQLNWSGKIPLTATGTYAYKVQAYADGSNVHLVGDASKPDASLQWIAECTVNRMLGRFQIAI